MNTEYTYFLFARPSFLGGAAALMDFGNTLLVYNESVTPAQADYFAAKCDWVAVGNDIRRAIKELEADREMNLNGGEQEAPSR
jgi:hypothetical protein